MVMTFDELISHYKSQTAAALAIGVRPASVCLWQERGSIPLPRQAQYELLTGGVLKSDPLPSGALRHDA